MSTYSNFEELPIFKEARRLFQLTVQLIQSTDAKNDFRFRDQLKASSGSVMDNIAEGFERESRLEFVNFLSIAKGSSGETRSQLLRGFDMAYWNEKDMETLKIVYQTLATHISNFMQYLNKSTRKGQKFKDRA